MRKLITINSIVSLILFTFFLQIKLANAQCANVSASDVTIAGATCQGNGSATLPNLPAGTVYKLSGGGLNGDLVQSSPVFESLSAGTYTVTLLCSGEPTNSFDITIPDKHSALGMTLTSNIVCEGQGTVSATATGGFDQGNSGTYNYALWHESLGGANRPDAGVSYATGNSWSNLSTGNYFVRVKDQCGNIFTQFIWVQASRPTASINLGNPSISCTGGALKYSFPRAILQSEPNKFTVFNLGTDPKYKYRIEKISPSGDCNTASVLSTIVNDTEITDPSTLSLSNVVPGERYRFVITSPCDGTQTSTCLNIEDAIGFEAKPSRVCQPVNGANTYLTINVYERNGYVVNFPGTIKIVGTDYDETVSFSNWADLAAIQKYVPAGAYPVTVTFNDNCVTQSIQRNAPPSGTSPSDLFYIGYYNCVDQNGNINFSTWPEGNWYGLEYNSGTDAEKTKYELIDNSTGLVVSSRYGLEYAANNQLTFPNVPAGKSYYVRVTPPASSNCAVQNSNVMNVPASEGLNFTVTPTVSKICNNGLNAIKYNIVDNTNYSITARLYSGTSATGTPVSTIVDPIDLNPGTYYYVITRIDLNFGCAPVTREGVITIDNWEVNPKISRSLSVNCQQLGSGPQNTGSTFLQFTGYGPFVVERSINGGSYSVVDPSAASSYTEASLVTGSVYNFRVTDQCGKSVSQQVMIKPLSPRITNNTIEPCVNQPYTLSGIDFGDPLTTYKWEKVGTSGTLATTREYTIPNFTAADNGSYKLTISLLNGCVVRESIITLNSSNCGQPFATGSIGDKVWFDTNSDGIQAASEAGVPGASVKLEAYVGPPSPTAADLELSTNWAVLDETITDASGNYKFEGLSTGYYRVHFDPVTNYGFTSYTQGSDTSLDSDAGVGGYSSAVFINAEGTGIDKDNMTIDAGLVPAGSIGDYVWKDDNQNGRQDSGESAISGLTVNLYVKDTSTGNWVLHESTTTDVNGKYLFDGLPTGTYEVEFTLPSGFVFTHANVPSVPDTEDSDANMSTGKSGEISINTALAETDNGRNNLTIDAGLVEGQLPVTLTSFTVKKGEGISAVLSWTTTEEINSDRFEVQRSIDANTWLTIGDVKAKVNSNALTNYRYDDMAVPVGNNYYRLKMIDTDGSFAYSSIKKLTSESGATLLNLFPNPVNNELSVVSNSGLGIVKVNIINTTGKVVLSKDEISNTSRISVKGLPSGMYVVKIVLKDGLVEYHKVVISH